MGKLLNAYSDLELDLRKLNIELVQDIFMYVSEIRGPRSMTFLVIVQKHTHQHRNARKHTHTHTHTRA